MFQKRPLTPPVSPAFTRPCNLRLAAFCVALASLASAAVLWHPGAVAAQAAGSAAQTAGAPTQAAGAAPNTLDFYNQSVLPILRTNCYRCHGGFNHRGGLNIVTRAGLLKGGHDGAVIVPGDASKSLLVRLIRHEGPADDPMPMPPKGKISDADIATITQWINAGAVMPADPAQ